MSFSSLPFYSHLSLSTIYTIYILNHKNEIKMRINIFLFIYLFIWYKIELLYTSLSRFCLILFSTLCELQKHQIILRRDVLENFNAVDCWIMTVQIKKCEVVRKMCGKRKLLWLLLKMEFDFRFLKSKNYTFTIYS